MGRRFPGPGSAGSGGGGGGSGGGGGTNVDAALHNGTPVSEVVQFDRTGLDTRLPYEYTSGMFPGASPSGNIKSRNVFATWAQWTDTTQGNCGVTITSFSVDRNTGAISILQSGPQDMWTNGTPGLSTTCLQHDAVHGCFLIGGESAMPGYTYGINGYTAGQVATDGSVNGGTYNSTGRDRGPNGTYCTGLNQGSGNNYFITSGYDVNNGYYAGHRINTASTTGLTIGNWVSDGSWTSTNYAFDHAWQPDTEVASGEPEALSGTSFNNPDYGWNVSRGSSVSTYVNPKSVEYGEVYTGAGGVTFMTTGLSFYGTIGNGSNSPTSLVDNIRDLGTHTRDAGYGYNVNNVGIGEDKMLFFRPQHPSFSGGNFCELIGFESNQNPKKLATLDLGLLGDKSVLDISNVDQCNYVVFENDNDTYPRWLVVSTKSATRYTHVKVFDMTADFASYTI